MTVVHYAATYGNANLLMNVLQQCDSDLVDKPTKVRSPAPGLRK